MKLTVIGEYGPFAPAGRACSCYLLQGRGSGNVVLDLGNGSLAELQKYLAPGEIDAIVLTHLHFDHISDLQILGYALGQMQARGEYQKKIRLFLPRTPEAISALYSLPFFEISYLEEDLEAQVAGMRLVFARMSHPVETYAVMAEEKGKCLLYSGDTTRNQSIEQLAEMADFVLLDAGLLEAQAGKNAPHMSVREACEVGRFAGQMVLTHHSPYNTEVQIRQEALEDAVLAQSGMTFEV